MVISCFYLYGSTTAKTIFHENYVNINESWKKKLEKFAQHDESIESISLGFKSSLIISMIKKKRKQNKSLIQL